MSRILILMRHGKTAEFSASGEDFERELEPRGRTEAKEAATGLLEKGITPELIIASPAFRTAITARIVAGVFNINPQKIIYNTQLYSGTSDTYLNVANLYPKKSILIVGHNPSVAELALYYYGNISKGFPTSSVAAFEFKNDEITLSDKAKLLYFNARK